MYRTFKGDSRMEVITMIARCTRPDHVVEAVTTYIANKQLKGRKTAAIIAKLEELERRFLADEMVCEAFHKARADMKLPRSRVLPESKHYSGPDIAGSPITPTRPGTSRSDEVSIIGSFYAETELSTSSGEPSLGNTFRTRPRGVSDPLPDAMQYVSGAREWERGLPAERARSNEPGPSMEYAYAAIARRMSGHNEPPMVVPHNLRLYRTSRSRGRSRSRDANNVVSTAAALSSGESDEDNVLRYRGRRESSIARQTTSAKRRSRTRIHDQSLGSREPMPDDGLPYRRRIPSRVEHERPRSPVQVYPIYEDESASINALPLHEVLEDQVEVVSLQACQGKEPLPPSRYSYRGLA